ncbi:hypothetical protein F53441_2753 [Fusarium austroafricanum]|uniref:Uncharacterized protein n=1 Tax=Fusarium austroafricanum TaxID=2364996 RepID=A0A8H4KNR2_9HYPO|nr:hypothetical protein F53441_2753 [Fusarium austroafricanum]
MTSNSGGSVDHIHYCPIWTDPNWQDDGPERESGVFDIKDNVVDRLRPALLPRDNFKRPTVYAQRFSVFPGRTDGRSRTSPTRAESRKLLFPSAEIQTGKQLFGRFDDLARAANEHIDDYMERTRPDMQKLDENEQRLMQQYEDLLIDENWQNLMFGGLTMDEIRAEGYFPMCDASLDGLSGPLYELFKRDRWVDNRCYGKTAEEPRFMYTLDGIREEWNPKTNDRVWNAMQPALQLASRLLHENVDDGFIGSLQDITKRLWVDPNRFKQQDGQHRDKKIQFKRTINPMDPRRIFGAKDVEDCIDVHKASWDALLQIFEIELSSGFNFKGYQQRDHNVGNTSNWSVYRPGDKVRVKIDAELVWPLIVDKYSKSEKLKASVILATTLAHEMMHAFAGVPYKWLSDPASVGIVKIKEIVACGKLGSALTDWKFYDRYEEPYFEDEPYGEVGHAFETHFMGGGYWGFGPGVSVLRPALLQTAAGLLSFATYPDGDLNTVPNLEYPLIRNMRMSHFVRFEDVKKFFAQAFWDVAVKKYRLAALRETSKRPHKITYHPADEYYLAHNFDAVPQGSPADKYWLKQFTQDILDARNVVLRYYLNNLITEACAFDFMIERFKTDELAWNDRDSEWYRLGKEALMIICEFSASVPQVHGNVIGYLYGCWSATSFELRGYPDSVSNDLARHSKGQFDWAIYTQRTGFEVYESRIITTLMDFARLLEKEIAHTESMVCEIYQMGSSFWPLYNFGGSGHSDALRQRVKKMSGTIKEILNPVGLTDQGIKLIDAEWFNRIVSLGQRTKDLEYLLTLDPNAERNWRDLLVTMPMLRKSRRKPHQRFYFLAKKEMMSLTGKQLEQMKEFKARFQQVFNLGGDKVVIPGEDPDKLGIAQRLSGTLDDDRGINDHDKKLRGPSPGIFNVEGLKNRVDRGQKDKDGAQNAMLNGIVGRRYGNRPKLREEAAAQAGQAPHIPPKFQQVGFEKQAVPLSGTRYTASTDNTPFAAYSSGTSSPFLLPQLNQPAAWTANTTQDMAAWVNQRLAGAPPAAHGIMPHPYAVRETLTQDLQNLAAISLPTRNPATFANEFPREVVEGPDSSPRPGPLGDIGRNWEQQSQLGQNSPPPATGTVPPRRDGSEIDLTDASSHGGQAMAVSDFDYSSSETEISDNEGQRTRERSSSGTTLVGSSDAEEELLNKTLSFNMSEAKGKGRQGLKRKSSWVSDPSKKRKLGVSKASKRSIQLKPKKAKGFKKKAGKPQV